MILINLLRKPFYISEIESKIASISGLATITALAAVGNNILDVNNLIKSRYNTKIRKIGKKVTDHNHDKYITSPEFNNLIAKLFAGRLAQGNLIIKTALIKVLAQIKQIMYLLKMNWKD